MKQILSQNLDIMDYIVNDDLEKIASIVEDVSETSKTAHIPSIEESYDLKDSDYALILWHPGMDKMPKFACYNPALTELNLACLKVNMSKMPEELIKVAAKNLTASAHKFGLDIPSELSEYDSHKFVNRIVDLSNLDEISFIDKTSSMVKKASHTYALEGKYPIDNKDMMKKASEWFDRNYNKLNIDQIQEFNSSMVKQASVLNYEYENSFTKLASDIFNPDLFSHVQIRKSYLSEDNEEAREAYDDLLRRADEIGPIKVAYVLEYLDKETGLNFQYGKNIIDPLHTACSEITKIGFEIDGIDVTLDQLRKIKNEDLAGIVGSDIIKELKSEMGLEILTSLPKPIRQEIINLIK